MPRDLEDLSIQTPDSFSVDYSTHITVQDRMTDVSLLILEDEGTMRDVVNELKSLNVPVTRFKSTPLETRSYNVTDPEVMLYARQNDMIVFTPDTANPSFTDVTKNDTRPPDVCWVKTASPPRVEIDTNLQKGSIELDRLNKQKHTVSDGHNGHNGVVRMFQLDYIQNKNAAKRIASKTKRYLIQEGAAAHNKIKDIRI